MTQDNSTNGFEIEGSDLDVDAVMDELDARIRTRRAEAQARGLDFEAYAGGLYPRPQGAILSSTLYEAVHTLDAGCARLDVEIALAERPLPIIGGLLHRLRASLHELVLFYVNRLAAQQVQVNKQTTRALLALVRDLEAEVHSLRARLAALEENRE